MDGYQPDNVCTKTDSLLMTHALYVNQPKPPTIYFYALLASNTDKNLLNDLTNICKTATRNQVYTNRWKQRSRHGSTVHTNLPNATKQKSDTTRLYVDISGSIGQDNKNDTTKMYTNRSTQN